MEYQHGGDVYSQKIRMDYSANINPFGLPKGVKEALHRAVEDCARYPDSESRSLTKALSAFYGVPQERIVCGNGAADLIFDLALALKPQKALIPAPTFSEYGQALRAAGCEPETAAARREEGFRLDAREFARRVGEVFPGRNEGEGFRGMAFLCNPNNPTGLSLSAEEVCLAAEACRRAGVLLAVDECFCEFLEEPGRVTVVPYLDQFPNVFVLKAFTKLYAMAGIRLGYGFCGSGEVLERLKEARQPWTVSALAQAAGEAALKETEYVERTRECVARERRYLSEGLSRLGFLVWPSEANYLFFEDPRPGRAGELFRRLKSRGVLIRSCANYAGLDGSFYRVCVKTREENRAFLEEVKTAAAGERREAWRERS